MKAWRTAACAAALSLGLSGTAAASTNLVVNGDFETGDFTGWSVGYTPGNTVCCMGFGATGGSRVQTWGAFFDSAIAGDYSAFGDWDGGDGSAPYDYNLPTDFFVRQLLTKTSDVTSATLSFQFNVAGGAFASYAGDPLYGGTIHERNVTASFLGADLSPQAVLFAFERPLQTGSETTVHGLQTVTLDVTAAFNSLADGQFYLDFGRHIPQYFTGPGYFVMDSVSLVIGDPVPPPSAVPEPAAWALMLLGFGGLGGLLRRRRPGAAARQPA